MSQKFKQFLTVSASDKEGHHQASQVQKTHVCLTSDFDFFKFVLRNDQVMMIDYKLVVGSFRKLEHKGPGTVVKLPSWVSQEVVKLSVQLLSDPDQPFNSNMSLLCEIINFLSILSCRRFSLDNYFQAHIQKIVDNQFIEFDTRSCFKLLDEPYFINEESKQILLNYVESNLMNIEQVDVENLVGNKHLLQILKSKNLLEDSKLLNFQINYQTCRLLEKVCSLNLKDIEESQTLLKQVTWTIKMQKIDSKVSKPFFIQSCPQDGANACHQEKIKAQLKVVKNKVKDQFEIYLENLQDKPSINTNFDTFNNSNELMNKNSSSGTLPDKKVAQHIQSGEDSAPPTSPQTAKRFDNPFVKSQLPVKRLYFKQQPVPLYVKQSNDRHSIFPRRVGAKSMTYFASNNSLNPLLKTANKKIDFLNQDLRVIRPKNLASGCHGRSFASTNMQNRNRNSFIKKRKNQMRRRSQSFTNSQATLQRRIHSYESEANFRGNSSMNSRHGHSMKELMTSANQSYLNTQKMRPGIMNYRSRSASMFSMKNMIQNYRLIVDTKKQLTLNQVTRRTRNNSASGLNITVLSSSSKSRANIQSRQKSTRSKSVSGILTNAINPDKQTKRSKSLQNYNSILKSVNIYKFQKPKRQRPEIPKPRSKSAPTQHFHTNFIKKNREMFSMRPSYMQVKQRLQEQRVQKKFQHHREGNETPQFYLTNLNERSKNKSNANLNPQGREQRFIQKPQIITALENITSAQETMENSGTTNIEKTDEKVDVFLEALKIKVNLNFQGTHLQIQKMFGPIKSENIIEVFQARNEDSKESDQAIFNRYLGHVKHISQNPIIEISIKFLKNEGLQMLESNHQVLKMLLNYLDLHDRNRLTISRQISSQNTVQVWKLIESKMDGNQQLLNIMKFSLLLNTYFCPFIQDQTSSQCFLSLIDQIKWEKVPIDFLLKTQKIISNQDSSKMVKDSNSQQTSDEFTRISQSDTLNMLLNEQIIMRQLASNSGCDSKMSTGQVINYKVFENLNTSIKDKYLEGEANMRDGPLINLINTDNSTLWQLKQDLGPETCQKFIVDEESFMHGRSLVQKNDPERNQRFEQHQMRNNSALDIFSKDEMKKQKKMELMQKREIFRKFHSKSASMDFASPKNSKNDLINVSELENDQKYSNDKLQQEQFFYQDTDREQGATGQDCQEITEPLSEIQSEIQLIPQQVYDQNYDQNQYMFEDNFTYERNQMKRTEMNDLQLGLKNFNLNEMDLSAQNYINIDERIQEFQSQNARSELNSNNWDYFVAKHDNLDLNGENPHNLLSGINQIANVFTKSNQTQTDQSKIGGTKSEFGSINSNNYLQNSDQLDQAELTKKTFEVKQNDQDENFMGSKDVKKDYKVISFGHCVKNMDKKTKTKLKQNKKLKVVHEDKPNVQKNFPYKSKEMINSFDVTKSASEQMRTRKSLFYRRSRSQNIILKNIDNTEKQALTQNIFDQQPPANFKYLRPKNNSIDELRESFNRSSDSRMIDEPSIQDKMPVQSKYQYMFQKNKQIQNMKSSQISNMREKSNERLNERLAMSILNSPNSYGSAANSRLLLGRTLNQTQFKWIPSQHNQFMKNSINTNNQEDLTEVAYNFTGQLEHHQNRQLRIKRIKDRIKLSSSQYSQPETDEQLQSFRPNSALHSSNLTNQQFMNVSYSNKSPAKQVSHPINPFVSINKRVKMSKKVGEPIINTNTNTRQGSPLDDQKMHNHLRSKTQSFVDPSIQGCVNSGENTQNIQNIICYNQYHFNSVTGARNDHMIKPFAGSNGASLKRRNVNSSDMDGNLQNDRKMVQEQLQKEFELEFGDTNDQLKFLDQGFDLNGEEQDIFQNDDKIDARYLQGGEETYNYSQGHQIRNPVAKDEVEDKLNQFLNMSMTQITKNSKISNSSNKISTLQDDLINSRQQVTMPAIKGDVTNIPFKDSKENHPQLQNYYKNMDSYMSYKQGKLNQKKESKIQSHGQSSYLGVSQHKNDQILNLNWARRQRKNSKKANEFLGQTASQQFMQPSMGLDVQHANILKELKRNFAETAQIQKIGDSPLMSDTLLSSIFQESQRDQKGKRAQFGFNNKENMY